VQFEVEITAFADQIGLDQLSGGECHREHVGGISTPVYEVIDR